MSEQPFVDCPICGNCSVRPEDAAEVERLREDLHNQQAQATEWAERFLRQRARAETAEGALRAVDENQRRQLEALGLLERFAPSSDLADDMGEALLTAERERDEYRTLAAELVRAIRRYNLAGPDSAEEELASQALGRLDLRPDVRALLREDGDGQ